MSPTNASRGPVENARPSSRPVGDYARSITRLVYTQNPFYLLSVAFVLHSTRLWYRQGAGPFDPWPLHESHVPTHRDWHHERPAGEHGSAKLLAEVLYRNPARQ